MAQTGFNQPAADEVNALAQYLEGSDLSAFRLACTKADPDPPTFENLAQRFFSTVTTRLTSTDQERLEAIARHEQLRKYVKTVRIEEDPRRRGPVFPQVLSYIWPRDDLGMIYTTVLEVESLKALFVAKALCPDTITIQDHDFHDTFANTDAAYALARDVTDGADLAILSIGQQRSHAGEIEIILNLSAQHQGQGVGFSMLHSVELYVKSSPPISYWVGRAFYHAPALENLWMSLDRGQGRHRPETLPLKGNPKFHLKQLAISSGIPTTSILTVLATSRHSLRSISFRSMSFPRGPTWSELLDSIAVDFTKLTSFHLRNLYGGGLPRSSDMVYFPRLTKDSVPEQYRAGLEVIEKGPKDKRRRPGVRYAGPGASEVLRIVAAHVVLLPNGSKHI